ncbi:MAG: arsenic resistance N-acetyltransferase ArsN2 [Bacteroidota bacterium]
MNNTHTFTSHKLTSEDQPWVVDLLSKANLPTNDVDLDVQRFIKIESNGKNIAIGALEIAGNSALLRSVVVPQNLQRKGAGIAVTKALINEAKKLKLDNLFLLTETAEKFFDKIGFMTIDRKEVPEEILSLEEFTNICPSTAACMTLKLNN